MLGYGKLSKQQMAHEKGGDMIGFEFSGYEVCLRYWSNVTARAMLHCSAPHHE